VIGKREQKLGGGIIEIEAQTIRNENGCWKLFDIGCHVLNRMVVLCAGVSVCVCQCVCVFVLTEMGINCERKYLLHFSSESPDVRGRSSQLNVK